MGSEEIMDLPVNYNLLTPAGRCSVREKYIDIQGGKCCHCGAMLSGKPDRGVVETPIDLGLFPRGFLEHPIHLHHNHETGMTIGAVHARCNAVLWQYHGE